MANGAPRAQWGSRLGFVLAAAGGAVGLGNIWKFPYIAGEYGGGAFVLFYLFCIAVVGMPLMYAELIIGRRGGKDPLGSLRALTKSSPAGPALSWVAGLMSVAGGFLILSFYSVVAGWAIHFLMISLGAIEMAPEGAEATFGALVGNGWMSALWHSVFMLITIVVVAQGIQKGIERACSILMPSLIGILLILLVYVGVTGGLGDSLAFLFRPNFADLTPGGMLEALGHAFFTLSLGMGAMITYGSYLGKDSHVLRDGVAVAILDTVIALLAGTVIFAVVFAAGKEPGAGPGLVFVTLPDLFQSMPGGGFFAVAFFFLLIFAAWSSAISLLEVVVTFFVDEAKMSRTAAAWGLGLVTWGLGMAVAFHGPLLDFLDNLTTRYLLPGGGLVIALIAGWMLSKQDREAGFAGANVLAAGWTFIIRFLTPVAVALVLLQKMGLLQLGG